jgi:hypothetical protein
MAVVEHVIDCSNEFLCFYTLWAKSGRVIAIEKNVSAHGLADNQRN